MNFFEQQDRTKKKTKQLILLFSLAVLVLAAATSLVAQVAFSYDWTRNQPGTLMFRGELFWYTFLITIGVVLIVSLVKKLSLQGGGKNVAEMLGGRLLNSSTQNFHEKRLLNIVQEMALASGIPVPDVYVLEENAINAFAAGYSYDDAVIGVTKGCMEKLNREELQGVVAHEFSHIHHGDMNINIKLIAILHGILFLHLIGRILLRSGGGRSSRRSGGGKGAGGIVLVGLALTVLGYIGFLFGRMIQSAVSRQREFLADASAVQYTRNPQGIAGALKKIGGFESFQTPKSFLENPKTEQVEHMMFAKATPSALSGFSGLFATHPPITERIRAIEPHFNPKQYTPSVETSIDSTPLAMGFSAGSAQVLEEPSQALLAQEQSWMQTLALPIMQACQHPQKAKALMYLLATDFNSESFEASKQILLKSDRYLVSIFEDLHTQITTDHFQHRIELFDLAMPSLRRLSKEEYRSFSNTLLEIVQADHEVSLGEWIFVQLIKTHLHRYFFNTQHPVVYTKEMDLMEDLKILFSAIAYTGQEDISHAQIAFDKGFSIYQLPQTTIAEQARLNLQSISRAFEKLQQSDSKIKSKAIEAMKNIVLSDEIVSWEEFELFRAFSDGLGNPVSPIQM